MNVKHNSTDDKSMIELLLNAQESGKTLHIWHTRYFLSNGTIEEYDAIVANASQWLLSADTGRYTKYLFKGEWHISKGEAIKKARSMCEKKMISIKKQEVKTQALIEFLDKCEIEDK